MSISTRKREIIHRSTYLHLHESNSDEGAIVRACTSVRVKAHNKTEIQDLSFLFNPNTRRRQGIALWRKGSVKNTFLKKKLMIFSDRFLGRS
jgi:hypothetical protein